MPLIINLLQYTCCCCCCALQTIAEREALEQQEEAAAEEAKQRLNERQVRGSNAQSYAHSSSNSCPPAYLACCNTLQSLRSLLTHCEDNTTDLPCFTRKPADPHATTAAAAAVVLCTLQQETRQLLVQVIAADEAAARAAAAPVALKEYEEIDTGDEAEPDAIEQWQRREAARIRCEGFVAAVWGFGGFGVSQLFVSAVTAEGSSMHQVRLVWGLARMRVTLHLI
jgi:hypothetical protein